MGLAVPGSQMRIKELEEEKEALVAEADLATKKAADLEVCRVFPNPRRAPTLTEKNLRYTPQFNTLDTGPTGLGRSGGGEAAAQGGESNSHRGRGGDAAGPGSARQTRV